MTRPSEFNKLVDRGESSQLIDYVDDNANLFKLLIYMYIAGPYRRTQHLAGVVTVVSLKYPHLLTPHFTRPAFRSRGVKVLRKLRGTLPLEMTARSVGK